MDGGAGRHAPVRARSSDTERCSVDGELHSFGEGSPAGELRSERSHERIACTGGIYRLNERRRNTREVSALHEHGAHRDVQRDCA